MAKYHNNYNKCRQTFIYIGMNMQNNREIIVKQKITYEKHTNKHDNTPLY